MSRLIEIPDDGIIRMPIMRGEDNIGERNIDLSDFPVVDAVPVVRCRECEHCDSTVFNGNFIGFCKIRKDSYGAKLRVGLSDYCSDGERKEGAD